MVSITQGTVCPKITTVKHLGSESFYMNIIKAIIVNWRKIIVCYILLAAVLDYLCYAWAHDLLGDFLEGSIGHNRAKKLQQQQKQMGKILMNYIPAKICKNQTTFRRYYRLYRIWLFLRVIAIVVFLLSLFKATSCRIILLFINVVTTFIITTIFRIPSWPNSTSFYSERKK